MRQILGQLCPSNEFVGRKGSGCHVCPEYTTSPGEKTDSYFEYAIRGRFLSAASDDLVFVLNGCTPHVGGDRDAILLTRKAGTWKPLRRVGTAGRCRKIPSRSGRDGLLCLLDDTHFGNSAFWLIFSHIEPEQYQELLVVRDFREGACGGAYQTVPAARILSIEPDKTKLTINAVCSRGQLTPEWRKRCDNDGEPGEGMLNQPPQTFQIDYTFDGERFVLGSASVAAKRLLEACAALPEN